MNPRFPRSSESWSRLAKRRLPTLLTWLFGSLIAVAVLSQSRQALRREVGAAFERRASDLHETLQHRLQSDLEVLYSARDYVESSDAVLADEFKSFADAALARHTALRSLHYAYYERPPCTTDAVSPTADGVSDRGAARESNAPGDPNAVRARSDSSSLPSGDVPCGAAARAQVLFSVADPDQRTFAGLDLRANARMRWALDRTLETGAPSASEPLLDLASGPTSRLIGVALAVPERFGPFARPRGFALAAFDVDDLVESSMRGLNLSDLTLRVEDWMDGERKLVHATARARTQRAGLAELRFEKQVEFAGRTWRFTYEPASEYAVAGWWRPWAAASGVLSLTALLALYLQTLQDRNRRIQHRVEQRTRALEVANKQLRVEIVNRARVEKRLRVLIATTSRQDRTHAERIDELLRVAAQELGLEGGWLARAERGERVITHVLDPEGRVRVGQALALEHALCALPLSRSAPVALDSVSDSAWRDGPEAREERIHAYIGCPIRSGGRATGSLAFFSRRVPQDAFDQSDLNLVQLVANWVGQELNELAMEQRLEHQATHDALTGLPNRVLLRDRLAQALSSAHRSGAQVGLLYLDLDGFKQVNDRFGHEAGDRVLAGVTQRLRPLLREEDTLARLGGDEFAVLLPRIESATGAELVAERILDALLEPFGRGAKAVRLGTSIGIAVAPEDGVEPDEIVRRADLAMYAAKASGKNCWRAAQPAA